MDNKHYDLSDYPTDSKSLGGTVEPVVSDAFCKKCGGFVEYDKSMKLLCSPPKYRGDCKDCGEIYYTHCHKVG